MILVGDFGAIGCFCSVFWVHIQDRHDPQQIRILAFKDLDFSRSHV